jgi:hypothetical protein
MGNGNATFFDLCRCLRGQPPREGADWVSVVKLAKRSLTTPALYEFAARYSAQLPDDLHAYLKEQFARNLLRNHRLMKQLLEAIRALNGAGISPMLIKGAALLASRPSRMGHRIMADLDIVVDPKQTKSGLQCLLQLGYRVNSGDLDDPTVHYVAVERSNEVGQIDLHKRPPGPSYFFQVTNSKDNCIPLTNLGSSAVVPSSTCQALILINHDQFHDEDYRAARIDLRHLLDFRDLVNEPGGINWQLLAACGANNFIRNGIEAYVLTAQKLLGIQPPSDFPRGIVPRFQSWRCIQQILRPNSKLLLSTMALVMDVPGHLKHRSEINREKIGLGAAGPYNRVPTFAGLRSTFARYMGKRQYAGKL